MSARKSPSQRKEKNKVCPCGKPCVRSVDLEDGTIVYKCLEHGIVYRERAK